MRRVGQPREFGRNYRLRPGAYAVLPRGAQVLLTYQTNTEDNMQLPGGGIDPGESPLAALHREVFEETGWHITRPRRLGAFRRFTYMPEYGFWAEKVCTIYLAHPTRQIGPPSEPDHLAIWAPAEQAVEMLYNPGDRHFAALALDRHLNQNG